MIVYRFADLKVASELPLRELETIGVGTAETTLRIVRGTAGCKRATDWEHRWRAADGTLSVGWAREGVAIRLAFPGRAQVVLRDDGARVELLPETGVQAAALEHLVLDQVLPRVLSLRGRLVLHAAAVLTPNGAQLFLGDSGRGKSTLSASLARSGYPLIADDALVLRPRDSRGYEVLATYPGLRLWADSRRVLFAGEVGRPVREGSAKRRLGGGLQRTTGAHPVVQCFVLDEPEPTGPLHAERMSSRDALLEMVRQSFVARLHDRASATLLFERLSKAAEVLPFRRLRYPREFARLPEVHRATLSAAAAP